MRFPRVTVPRVLPLLVAAMLLAPAFAFRAPAEESIRRTPGPQPDGSVVLPNQWSLRPAGKQVEVGLRAVPLTHPLAGLRGTDNQIVFTTMRYREHPLVITGPGAGPAVTAAGVLNDILQLTPS